MQGETVFPAILGVDPAHLTVLLGCEHQVLVWEKGLLSLGF